MTTLTMQSLLITLQNRPYVAVFLAAFFAIGILNRGLARTFLFLLISYPVAFLSEFCSIRWGFPYGMYHYVYENMRGELMLGGVPVWDSISYVFMAYASYEMAAYRFWLHAGGSCRPAALCAASHDGLKGQTSRHPPIEGRKSISCHTLKATCLMTLLDIITDPLAVRGDQWFLGKVFYYPDGGIYFGVPLSNFAGWFIVGLAIFSLYTLVERVGAYRHTPLQRPSPLLFPILGPLFYLSIALFNLVITFWIGEWLLGIIGIIIFLAILIEVFRGRFRDRLGGRKDFCPLSECIFSSHQIIRKTEGRHRNSGFIDVSGTRSPKQDP